MQLLYFRGPCPSTGVRWPRFGDGRRSIFDIPPFRLGDSRRSGPDVYDEVTCLEFEQHG